MRLKTTRLGFETNFFCDGPFGHSIIPAALRSNTIFGGVGATMMTLIGAAIENSLLSAGLVPTSNRHRKPELFMTHVCHD